MIGIYQIRNKINNKIYIGQSIDIEKRWVIHRARLDGGYHGNSHLQRAWNKYGGGSFVFDILLLCEEYELTKYEQWFLDNIVRWKVDYNMTRSVTLPTLGMVGEDAAFYGKNHTVETRNKLSELAKGRYLIKENHPWWGRNHTKEVKKKMSIGKSGENHPRSKLTKEKVLMLRRMYLTEKYTQEVLGKLFNISTPHANLIISRKRWRCV